MIRGRGFEVLMLWGGDSSMVAHQRTLPRNEYGFSLCRTRGGAIVAGPVATGTPTSVQIPVACPKGSTFFGLYHTHPGAGAVAYPSPTDVASGRRTGSKQLCIQSNRALNCYALGRQGRR